MSFRYCGLSAAIDACSRCAEVLIQSGSSNDGQPPSPSEENSTAEDASKQFLGGAGLEDDLLGENVHFIFDKDHALTPVLPGPRLSAPGTLTRKSSEPLRTNYQSAHAV